MEKSINKPTRVQMKRKRRRNFFRTILVLLLMAFTVYFLRTSKIFGLKEFVLEGNKILTKAEIVNSIDEKVGTNIFKIKKKKVKSQVEKSPYVKSAIVKKKLPNKIIIILEERREVFTFKVKDKHYITDEEGFIVKVSEEQIGNTIVTGIEDENYKVGDNILGEKTVVSEFIKYIEEVGLDEKIRFLNIVDEKEIRMRTVDGKLIEYGDLLDYEYRLTLLNSTIDKANESAIVYSRIIMNRGENILLVTEEKGEDDE